MKGIDNSANRLYAMFLRNEFYPNGWKSPWRIDQESEREKEAAKEQARREAA